MIPISKIDNEFSIFKNNKVVIWGAGHHGTLLFQLFHHFKIEVYAFCDNNESRWGDTYNEKQIISPKQLKELAEESSVVVQIGVLHREKSIVQHLESLGVTNYVALEETNTMLPYLFRLNLLKKDPSFYISTSDSETLLVQALKKKLYDNAHLYVGKELVITLATGKTGNNTLMDTLNHHKIPNFFAIHRPEVCFHQQLLQSGTKVKYVTGVRDPIAWFFSIMFDLLTNYFHQSQEHDLILSAMEPPFFEHGGDVQRFFDTVNKNWCCQKDGTPSWTSGFFKRYQAQVHDIFSYDFQKEKGYTIIKEGNMEIFLYQLEKMNDILPEFSQFVGYDIPEWKTSNSASSKWVKNSYQRALKEVKIPKDLFEAAYEEEWVTHFYSQKDIEKMKEKWKNNVIR